MKIGYVVLTWNSENQIVACLDSIYSVSSYTNHVVVIDNGSSDTTCEKLKHYQCKGSNDQLDIVYLDKNFGTTKSRNLGIKKLLGKVDYLCILDSDTVINKEAIQYMIHILEKHPNIGIVGPQMKTKSGVIQQSGRKFPSVKIKICKAVPFKKIQEYGESLEYIDFNTEKEFYEVDYLMSACWLMKADTCKKIGYLDEKIFYAPEDVDYCMRAKLLGYKIAFVNKVSIIHEWQRLSKKKLISKMNFEHIKGLIYYFKKYHYCMNANKARLKEKVK